MREEIYNKRYNRNSPRGTSLTQPKLHNLGHIDMPVSPDKSLASESDDQEKGLGSKRDHNGSAFPHEVPSAFEGV